MIYHIVDDQIIELTDEYIEYLYHAYLPDDSLIVADNKSLDSITIPSKITNIIFDDCTNPIDIEKHLQKINLDRNYIMLSGLYKYHHSTTLDPRVKFFPFWAIWMNLPHGRLMPMPNHKFSTQPKKYKFSCLNGTGWNHRILTYLSLINKSYFKEMVFTFGNRQHCQDNLNELILTEEEKQEFNSLNHNIKFLDNELTDIDLSVNHPAYRETYINLVTETTINNSTPMLSEKTFKPIIAGQLFILIASPGAVQFLRNLDIDTFDDIIDHHYDTVIDPRTRIKLALDQLDQLDRVDLNSIYNQIKPRLIKNSEYFLSQRFRDQFKLSFG